MERTYDEKIHRRIYHEDLCAEGTFKRCNQNPLSMWIKQRVLSQTTVGEIKIALENLGNHLDES